MELEIRFQKQGQICHISGQLGLFNNRVINMACRSCVGIAKGASHIAVRSLLSTASKDGPGHWSYPTLFQNRTSKVMHKHTSFHVPQCLSDAWSHGLYLWYGRFSIALVPTYQVVTYVIKVVYFVDHLFDMHFSKCNCNKCVCRFLWWTLNWKTWHFVKIWYEVHRRRLLWRRRL